MRKITVGLFLACLSCFLFACSITRPCSEAGDLSDIPKIKGDKKCYQKKQKDGSYKNDGKFFQYHPNGNIALEGEFKDGEKNGTWTQYDEAGKKIAVRYFENGVEYFRGPPSKK